MKTFEEFLIEQLPIKKSPAAHLAKITNAYKAGNKVAALNDKIRRTQDPGARAALEIQKAGARRLKQVLTKKVELTH